MRNGGTLLEVESFSSKRPREIDYDLGNFSKLFKPGNVAKHEGLLRLTCCGVFVIRVGFDFSVGATRAKVKAETQEAKALLVTGSSMCRAKDEVEERADEIPHLDFAVEFYCEQVKHGCCACMNIGQQQVGKVSVCEK